jgi:hypothetical protein
MSPIVYPTTVDTFTTIPPGTTQDVAVGGRQHLDMHNDADAAIIQLEEKVGAGAALQTPTGGAVLTGLTDGTSQWLPAYPYRNRLRNGRMNVAQRGTTPTPTPTDNLYGLDGWRVLMENSSGVTVTQDTADVPTGAKYAQKMVVGSGNNGKFGIFQVLDNDTITDIAGDVASLQVKLKATSGIVNARAAICIWTGTADATTSDPVTTWGADGTNPTLSGSWAFVGTPVNLNPTTSWATYKVAEGAAISGSATNLGVLVWNDDRTTTQTTDILRIADVQLERGKVCTDIERTPRSLEVLRCQWHLEVFNYPGFEAVCSGQAYNTTHMHGQFMFSPKRATPAVTVSAAGDFSVTDASFAGLGATAMASSQIGGRSAWLDVTVASGLVAGNGSAIVGASSGVGKIYVSAEI